MTKPNLDVLAGAVDSLKIACKLLRDDLAAANQQLDALRAELAKANASREKLSQKLADVQHAHSGSLDVVDHLRSELAALRQSTEADAEPVCWMVRSSLFDLPFMTEEAARAYARVEGLTVRPAYERPAPVEPEPAPSPSARKVCSFCQDTEPRILNGDNSASVCGYCAGMHWDICRPDDPSPAARAEEPAGYANRYEDGWGRILPTEQQSREASIKAVGRSPATEVAVPLYTSPPDLTAEIARLMMEKERKQHMIEERDAEIAKLKAEVERLRKVVMTMPASGGGT